MGRESLWAGGVGTGEVSGYSAAVPLPREKVAKAGPD